MVPDHLQRRAKKYRQRVAHEAKRQQLDIPLIFAIMETESFFNPKARSPVPAFGLMQLVPSSGARDAYRFLHKQDKLVTDRYLYDADQNIEMGSAYLHILMFRYLKGITNEQSRQWCAIAAYNTGAGNVYRAFVGQYRRSTFGDRKTWKKQALAKINALSSEQVYQHLRQHLPYKETQHYMKKVRKRMQHYQAWRS